MYLHHVRKWVGRRGRTKGKLYQNFTVADWLVYWLYLPEITGVIGKQKTEVSGIWCHLIHNQKLKRRFLCFYDFLLFSQGCVSIHIVWIIFGPLSIPPGSTDRLSTVPNLFRHLCAAGSPYTRSMFTGGRMAAREQPGEGRGLCVQHLLQWYSSNTEPDLCVETFWPCMKGQSTSSPRQSK